jgi:hypothetical protein
VTITLPATHTTISVAGTQDVWTIRPLADRFQIWDRDGATVDGAIVDTETHTIFWDDEGDWNSLAQAMMFAVLSSQDKKREADQPAPAAGIVTLSAELDRIPAWQRIRDIINAAGLPAAWSIEIHADDTRERMAFEHSATSLSVSVPEAIKPFFAERYFAKDIIDGVGDILTTGGP